MDTTNDSGLSVSFDEEAGIITLDWDENTHPQWNFLNGMTSDEFCDLLQNYLDELEKIKNTEVSGGGSSCRAPQGDCNSEFEA